MSLCTDLWEAFSGCCLWVNVFSLSAHKPPRGHHILRHQPVYGLRWAGPQVVCQCQGLRSLYVCACGGVSGLRVLGYMCEHVCAGLCVSVTGVTCM